MLTVDPSVRGRCIGETPVVALLRRTRERTLVRAVLSTQPTNGGASALRAAGLPPCAPERDWARPGVPRLLYTLDL